MPTHTRLSRILALTPALLLVLALPAFARGGRYGAPSPRAPGSATESDSAETVPSPACSSGDPTAPTPPTVAPPTTTVDGSTGRGPRTALAGGVGIGLVDWLHWYEARRERFEDYRAWAIRTETSPLFEVGDANGPGVGRASARVSDRVRKQILDALLAALDGKEEHWLPTEAAAYVALGKIATGTEHIAPHLAALTGVRQVPEYIRESAVLGLGHLARTDPATRLPAVLLDRVRGTLLDVLVDDSFGIRTRGFAGLSLGLLSDQPSMRGKRVGTWTAEQLFHAWNTRNLPDGVQVGLLLGLSRVEPDAVPRVIRLVLEGCALRGRDWPSPASALVRAHSLVALGRVGDVQNASAIVALLGRTSGETTVLKQAAALAAEILGSRDPRARLPLGEALLKTLAARGDPGTRHYAWIALGRLLAAEAADGRTDLVKDAKAGARLIAALKEARPDERAFVALALGIAVAGVDHTVDSGIWQGLRFDGIERLRKGLDAGSDGHLRSAHAVALGLAQDRHSGSRLLTLLRQEDADPEIRAYAALALGLLGDARQGVVPALTDALASPRSELLRMRAATALGLLGGGGPDDRDKVLRTLVTALRTTRSQAFKGQIAVTLGRIGDPRAVKPLMETLDDAREAHLNRAIACAALGLVGEEELRPLMAATREEVHYLGGTEVVRELLDLL